MRYRAKWSQSPAMMSQGVVKIISKVAKPTARSASYRAIVPAAVPTESSKARARANKPVIIRQTVSVASDIGISRHTGICGTITEAFRVGAGRRTMRDHKLNFCQSYIPQKA